MQYFSLIEWPKPFLELYYFCGLFFAIGAIGFRYSSLRGRLHDSDRALFERMARRAAWLGALGAVLILCHILEVLPSVAVREKTTVEAMLTTLNLRSSWFYLTVIAIVSFVFAGIGRKIGWPLAALGILIGLLRYAFVGEWTRLIVPGHILAGGLWIGTLFMLVVNGIGVALKYEKDTDRRGVVVADLVNAFSPLAVAAGAAVVTLGVWASLRELEPFAALWTTPFGYTLIAKVAVVAVVFALGGWNWRRQRPSLGTAEAARSLRRSAIAELAAASLVLILTAVMVSLPSPG